MRNKNYYKILEIPLSASQQEVKKAYRLLAMKYHPDKNVENKFAESHFREINEAYQVLSDPNRRSAYNQARWYRQSLHQQNAKVITPESILVKCKDLNQYIRQLDHYRINQQALHTYIMHLLSERNLRILTENGNREVNSAVIDEMLHAGKLLSYTYMKKLGEQLMRLAVNDIPATKRIFSCVRESRINGYWQQYQPFLILVVTLLLCWLIYLISK